MLPKCKEHLLLSRVAPQVAVGMARAGVLERCAPVHVLQSRRDVDAGSAIAIREWVVVVGERLGHVNRDPAQRVYNMLEAGEVNLCIIVHLDPEVFLNG